MMEKSNASHKKVYSSSTAGTSLQNITQHYCHTYCPAVLAHTDTCSRDKQFREFLFVTIPQMVSVELQKICIIH